MQRLYHPNENKIEINSEYVFLEVEQYFTVEKLCFPIVRRITQKLNAKVAIAMRIIPITSGLIANF